MEFSFIELCAFGIVCWAGGNAIVITGIFFRNLIIDHMDGDTPLVRYNLKSELDRALGKKE